MRKQRIEVSPEMLSFVGAGTVVPDWPGDWLVLCFDGLRSDAPVRVMTPRAEAAFAEADLVFAVDRAACHRLFDFLPQPDQRWHLPSELRAVALEIIDCTLPEPASVILRLAKSLELLLAVLDRAASGRLVAADDAGELREGDAVRILAARRMIDENWREKLTLDGIARACGLNRAKLTRGFRLMFNCSVADALAENRLTRARHMLRETDMAVSSIGYACGYGNNASFTRAFSRRFGLPPSQLRQVAA